MYLGWLKHGRTAGTILHVNYRHRSKFMHSNVAQKVHEYTAVHMPVLYMFPPEVFLLSVLPETLNYLYIIKAQNLCA